MAVVDLWIAAGQSNMAGLGDHTLTPSNDPTLALEFNYEANTLIPLVDPGTSTAHDASTGCMLPAFIKVVTQSTGRRSVIVRTAVGGTSILAANAGVMGTWATSGTLFANAITRAQAMIAKVAAAGHTIAGVNVLWHQGEQDCKSATTYADYKAAYIDLLSRFRTALSRPALKMYCMRIGSVAPAYEGLTGAYWETVRTAQVDACAETDGLEMAYLRCVDFFDLHWMRSDQAHYTQAGYNDMGTEVGTYAVSDMGFTPVLDPEVPASISSSSAPAILLRAADQIFSAMTWDTPGEYSYVVPPGLTTLKQVKVNGAGGGGGHSPSLNSKFGGGGGGGGYSSNPGLAVTPGETLTIKVGAAGSGGLVTGPVASTAGGETGVFRGATALVRVAGGGAGTAASGAASSPGGAAGDATHGSSLTDGNAGSAGTTSGGTGLGGAAVGEGGGAGGASKGTASGDGNAGSAYGGGGTGGKNGGNGGSGARGRVRIVPN